MELSDQSEELYTTFKYLTAFCKIVGLAPYSFRKCKKNKSKYYSEYLGFGWTVCYFILVLLISCSIVIYQAHTSDTAKEVLVNVLAITSLFTTCIVSLLVFGFIQTQQVPQVIKEIGEVDQILVQPMKRRHFYNRMWKLTTLHLVLKTILLEIPFIISLTYAFGPHPIHALKSMLNIFYAPSVAMMTLFATLVFHVRQRYKLLNSELQTFHSLYHKHSDFSERKRKSMCVIDIEKAVDRIQTSVTTERKIHKINRLRIIHSKLHDTVQIMNSTFGFPLFVACSWIFLHTIYMLSFLLDYTAFHSGITTYDSTQERMIFNSFLTFITLLSLVEVCISCHSVAEESKNTVTQVRKLLLRFDIPADITNEYQRFLVHVNYGTVEFTACGFYTINLPFLHTMVGVISSYFVVLAQIR